jgi:biotin operon repressor
MAELSANPTDAAISRLLAGGPAPTAALAARLGVPERTVRHRLYRLRQAGTVVTGPDGLHRLAAPLVALAAPVPPTPIAGPLPSLAAPVVAPDFPANDGPFTRHGGHPRARTVLAAAALGIAVAGGLAVVVGIRRMSPPPPPPAPAPPTGFGDAWGWMPGPTW